VLRSETGLLGCDAHPLPETHQTDLGLFQVRPQRQRTPQQAHLFRSAGGGIRRPQRPLECSLGHTGPVVVVRKDGEIHRLVRENRRVPSVHLPPLLREQIAIENLREKWMGEPVAPVLVHPQHRCVHRLAQHRKHWLFELERGCDPGQLVVQLRMPPDRHDLGQPPGRR
jgi:hypothetical protein